MGKGRAPCCDKDKVKRGPWSPQEDLKLISFIQKHGHLNWRSLPNQAGLLRCGKSCRLRWINYLRPDVKRGNFTKEEEETIIKLHVTFGNKWSKIASELPGRTDNEIKNVWHTHLKKKLLSKSTMNNDNHQSKQESSSCITSPSSSSSSTEHHLMKTTSIPQTDNNINQDQCSTDQSSISPICKVQDDHHQMEPVAAGSSLMWQEDESKNYTVVLNEVVDKPANNCVFLEIPLGADDDDFWNILDDNNIGADGGGSLISNNHRHHQIHHPDAESMNYWIREIEKDLGLEPQASSYSDDLTTGLSDIYIWPNNGCDDF